MSRPLVKRGDRVGVVATAFAVAHDALDAGVAALRRRGLVPVLSPNARAESGYLAGDDAERASGLNAAIADPTIAAIWFTRGGYGTARILDRVDIGRLARRPKTLIGYSDLTALFSALLSRTRAVCLHGPSVADLGRKGAFHAPSLAAALAGKPIARRIVARDVMRPGAAKGRLMGGNLTVLAHLLGTPYMPDLSGAILFLEEIGEEGYRVDRLLQHLRMSGALNGIRGVLLGSFQVPATKRAFPGDREASEILRDHLLPLGVPVVANVPSGHAAGKWTLPLGGTASFDTGGGRMVFDPAPAPPKAPRGARRR